MIQAVAGETFEAVLEGAPVGLVGTIAVRVIETPAGGVVVARSTAGITSPAPGVYVAERVIDVDATADTSLLVVWDLGDPADAAATFTEELALTLPGAAPAPPAPSGGGVTLDPESVRLATAALMAYRLRVGGFVAGRGGTEVADFTADTTPTLARATEVVTRNAALVSDDFPAADAGDEPELETIAALRSAIELEASAPAMDADRIRVWREQLREYVERAGSGAGGGGGEPGPGEPGYRVLAPVWSFWPPDVVHVEGSEADWPTVLSPDPNPSRRRLRW